MRENRPYGSEGGVAQSHPDPYPLFGATALALIGPYFCVSARLGTVAGRLE
jgi:hypothetical protein